MDTPAPASRHLLRWIALGAVVVVAALVAGVAIYVHSLLQPERFTTLLANDLAGVGLNLQMHAPAEPALFPRPAVQLHSFSLTNAGSDIPVLKASGATIVVPWHALWRGEVAIERIDVDAPHIDLGELRATLARLPRRAGPPRLPAISAGVHMHKGMITNNGSPMLFGFSLDTGSLVPDQTFRVDASGHTATGRRLVARLSTVPSAPSNGAIEFGDIRINLAEQPGSSLELGGKGSWRGGENIAMHLQGTFRHHSFAPTASGSTASAKQPAASTSTAANPSDQMVSDRIVLAIAPPALQQPLQVSLKLDGPGTHVDMAMHPTEFGAWWQRVLIASPDQPPGPLPFTGKAEVRHLDLGWLKASGLSIRADPDLSPAPAATARPASSAPVPD